MQFVCVCVCSHAYLLRVNSYSQITILSYLIHFNNNPILQVDNNTRIVNRLDTELDKCQNEMFSLKKELDYAQRCVEDIEVNCQVGSDQMECDQAERSAGEDFYLIFALLRCFKGNRKSFTVTAAVFVVPNSFLRPLCDKFWLGD
jgi:hypothetical protein